MIATRNTVEPAVLLEGAPLSSSLIDDLATAAATYTSLRVETSLDAFASDHVPFLEAGVPAVLTIEGADSANANIHTAQDTMQHIDVALARENLAMNLAALATWLKPDKECSPPQMSSTKRSDARSPASQALASASPADVLSRKIWANAARTPGAIVEALPQTNTAASRCSRSQTSSAQSSIASCT